MVKKKSRAQWQYNDNSTVVKSHRRRLRVFETLRRALFLRHFSPDYVNLLIIPWLMRINVRLARAVPRLTWNDGETTRGGRGREWREGKKKHAHIDCQFHSLWLIERTTDKGIATFLTHSNDGRADPSTPRNRCSASSTINIIDVTRHSFFLPSCAVLIFRQYQTRTFVECRKYST